MATQMASGAARRDRENDMQALVLERFGGPEVLTWQAIDAPRLPPCSALVRIKAAGLNFADIYRRRGDYHMDATPPWILGYEGAGEIIALSDDAEGGFAVGDRVGFADVPRANAELVAAPLDRLIKLPDDIGFDTAAALLLQGLTAHYLIHDSARPRSGDVVVVHAAAGGVGLLLTQMLAARGVVVVALASSEAKRAAARTAGATHVLGYDADWPARVADLAGRGADIVYDSVGTTLAQSLDAARIGGTVVFYGFAGGDPAPVDPRLLMDRSLTLTGGDLWNVLTGLEERRRRAAELFEEVRKGRLIATIAARVPLFEGSEAHRLLEGRGVIGKIVLTND